MIARSRMKRGTARIGRASAKRRKAGGARVKGRPAVSVTAWKAIVLDLTTRCGSICEVPWCRKLAVLDPDHTTWTGRGCPDDANFVAMICRRCHERKSIAYVKGKLVIEPLGGERFRFALEYRQDKRGPLLAGSMQELYARPDGTF